jgi:hypothetical protein
MYYFTRKCNKSQLEDWEARKIVCLVKGWFRRASQNLAGELTEVDPFREITFRGSGPRSLEMGAKHCCHTACPVPVGVIKAVAPKGRGGNPCAKAFIVL